MTDQPAAYVRSVLVEVLVYHYRTDTSGCGCGWAELGRSHPEHVADVYEMAVGLRADHDACHATPPKVEPGSAEGFTILRWACGVHMQFAFGDVEARLLRKGACDLLHDAAVASLPDDRG